METIFDHNPTDEEVRKIVGSMTQEEYLKFLTLDKDNNTGYYDIAYLYYYRSNLPKMRKYSRKMTSINMINSFWRNVTHP